jgi:hypothetical protein
MTWQRVLGFAGRFGQPHLLGWCDAARNVAALATGRFESSEGWAGLLRRKVECCRAVAERNDLAYVRHTSGWRRDHVDATLVQTLLASIYPCYALYRDASGLLVTSLSAGGLGASDT